MNILGMPPIITKTYLPIFWKYVYLHISIPFLCMKIIHISKCIFIRSLFNVMRKDQYITLETIMYFLKELGEG